MLVLQLLVNGIISGSIYALVALGFTLIYGTVRFFHFAHGVVYTMGAYIAFSLIAYTPVSLVPAFFLSVISAASLGLCIDRVAYAPLRKRKAPPFVFLISSFGVLIFFQNFISLVWGNEVKSLRSSAIREGYEVFGTYITPIQLSILIVSISILFLLRLLIKRTNMGRAMRAMADDHEAAEIVGVDPERIIALVFGVGSALAGIAGILIGLERDIEPTMGVSAILKGIIASIVGGIGSVPGAVLGGFLLGIGENIGVWKVPAHWKDPIAFAILIAFLLVRPKGFFGRDISKAEV